MKRPVVFTVFFGLVMVLPSNVTAGQKKTSPKKASSSSWSRSYPQRAPTKERYKQIQTALLQRGYNPGPIDGSWGSKTSRALRRFEKDHNLPADGKLDALALITLGLGPQRLSSVNSNHHSIDKKSH